MKQANESAQVSTKVSVEKAELVSPSQLCTLHGGPPSVNMLPARDGWMDRLF